MTIEKYIKHLKKLKKGSKNMKKEVKKETRKINVIAMEIIIDWNKPYFGAIPYLNAMRSIEYINDMYGMDSARTIINYFLCNATTWKGERARQIKAELKEILKNK